MPRSDKRTGNITASMFIVKLRDVWLGLRQTAQYFGLAHLCDFCRSDMRMLYNPDVIVSEKQMCPFSILKFVYHHSDASHGGGT